jgi:iron complex transport system ATP-binding protein
VDLISFSALEYMMTIPTKDATIVLETKHLDVHVPGRTLIKDLTWQVKRGERWCLIGRNGAGKSTLLRVIAGVQPNASAGEINCLGQALTSFKPEALAKVRAYAEQFPVGGVGLRVIDIVLAAQWPWHLDDSSGHEQAQTALRACDVAHLEHAQWQTLSGGERQRVSLAACFAQNTQIILLDEPTSHLDIGHQVVLLNTLVQQSKACEQAIIASMHDIGLIQRGFTHALLLMDDGSYLAGSLSELINPINLEKSLGHPISTAQTAAGQTIYVPA